MSKPAAGRATKKLRNTKYAKELSRAEIYIEEPEEYGRVEKLFIKEKNREEVRFS